MENLKQTLIQDDTVLFIGSGISSWSSLPSWTGLVYELADFVDKAGYDSALIRKEVQKGDLLQAASYGFDLLTKQAIGEFIKQVCRYGIAQPHEIHQKIVSLGPRCFITTNYDDLIEKSLRKWQPDRFYRPPITNRHLTEMADIIHARAIDFVFKPHGDASDSESIILTREQYRLLSGMGERHATLESLKMLLASRPVVYLGFGLRDPDFLYLRDILANTYKGASRDHYAIMADVSEQEINYWKRQYGIHLINYDTIETPSGSRDHSNLINLLDELGKDAKATKSKSNDFDPNSPETLLALARHASALSQSKPLTTEFKIRVRKEYSDKKKVRSLKENDFDYALVNNFLDKGPERALLIGLPGAGKTYSIKQSVKRLAERLYQRCMVDTAIADEKDIVVPILVDLKLYKGDLPALIEQSLPKNLPLRELISHFRVRLFLDSFNEMPREYWETGTYEPDFEKFLKSENDFSVIIGSRTNDGLGKLDWPVYSLDQIERRDVKKQVEDLGLKLGGVFDDEVMFLLQRPFYFQFVINRAIELPNDAHPKDFYRLLFEKTSRSFNAKFGLDVELDKILSIAAYNALNAGEEAFPLNNLLQVVKRDLESKSSTIEPREIANWLVANSMLVPYTNGRVAFIHQSITEYLAAKELAIRYQVSPAILKEKLSLTRWDQALFLTLSVLPEEYQKTFLQDIVKVDFNLALNATKYVEVNRDEIINQLLNELVAHHIEEYDHDWRMHRAIAHTLPIGKVHTPIIRKILGTSSTLSSAAAARLIINDGESVKDEMLEFLFTRRGDYNFCSEIGRSLKSYITLSDANVIYKYCQRIAEDPGENLDSDDEDDSIQGFISGAAYLLSELDILELTEVIKLDTVNDDKITGNNIWIKILSEIIYEARSARGLEAGIKLLLLNSRSVAFSIYLFGRGNSVLTPKDLEIFDLSHIDKLIENLFVDETWSVNCLNWICSVRPDLARHVNQIANQNSGFKKSILLYCANGETSLIFDFLKELVESNCQSLGDDISIIEKVDLDWTDKEELFSNIIHLRNRTLNEHLLGGSIPVSVENLGEITLNSIEIWLEYMLDIYKNANRQDLWYLKQLGSLFAHYTSNQKQQRFIAECNNPRTIYRPLLIQCILPYFEVTSDSFSEETLSFLLAGINQEEPNLKFIDSFLIKISTEPFVNDRLLPLIPESKDYFRKRLKNIIVESGLKFGKRYDI